MKYKEINTPQTLCEAVSSKGLLTKYVFQDMDFRLVASDAVDCRYSDCIFLGGDGIDELRQNMDEECIILPSFRDIPYNTFSGHLYNAYSLYSGYRLGDPSSYEDTYDSKVYQHYLSTGKQARCVKETLARMLHDRDMNDAMQDFLNGYDERKVVGIMGGHGLLRTEDSYRRVVVVSKRLTEAGYLMISGGGPGAMEATHLGAWLAGHPDDDVVKAISVLSEAPSFKDRLWLETAFRVMEKFDSKGFASLGIPTWLYGHEPATPFATHIAKYFENSIREDNIVTIAKGGIVYSPGSAGTMQEIFQDAVQNHYLSFGYSSPMIFLGKDFWTKEMPVYTLMEHLLQKGRYKNLMLLLTDSVDDIVEIISSTSHQVE